MLVDAVWDCGRLTPEECARLAELETRKRLHLQRQYGEIYADLVGGETTPWPPSVEDWPCSSSLDLCIYAYRERVRQLRAEIIALRPVIDDLKRERIDRQASDYEQSAARRAASAGPNPARDDMPMQGSLQHLVLLIDGRVVATIGLVLDCFGAVLLAVGLIMSKKQVLERGGTRWMSGDDEKDLNNPTVQALIRDSNRALFGIALLSVGFALQIVGAWID